MTPRARHDGVSVTLDVISATLSLRELEVWSGLVPASGSYSKGDDRHGRVARESVLKVAPEVERGAGLEARIHDLLERTARHPGLGMELLSTGAQLVLSIALFPDSEDYSSTVRLPQQILESITKRGWELELTWYRSDAGER